MINLQTITNKARTNTSHRTRYTIKPNNITFGFKYSDIAEGYNGQYLKNTFYVFNDGVLIGDLYDNQDGTYDMWVDDKSVLVKGLTQPLHIERAWIDGNLTDNPIY